MVYYYESNVYLALNPNFQLTGNLESSTQCARRMNFLFWRNRLQYSTTGPILALRIDLLKIWNPNFCDTKSNGFGFQIFADLVLHRRFVICVARNICVVVHAVHCKSHHMNINTAPNNMWMRARNTWHRICERQATDVWQWVRRQRDDG